MNHSLRSALEAHRTLSSWKPSVALVVQGGGMRGVYSMGALAHLEKSGLRDSFDLIIGSSAGAINGAYLLAGQAVQAVDVYVEGLSNRNFVNPFRFRKIVDIDYMVDVALKQELPLDLEALRRSRSLLQVVLTDAMTGEAKIVTNRQHHDFYEVIRATAALPTLYDRTVEVGGRAYLDGGVADSVPVQRALDAGVSLAMAVVTRPFGYRPSLRITPRLSRMASAGQSPAVRQLIGGIGLRLNSALDLVQDGVEGKEIVGVWPSDARRMVGRTTRDRETLKLCAAMGEEDMRHALDQPVSWYPSHPIETGPVSIVSHDGGGATKLSDVNLSA